MDVIVVTPDVLAQLIELLELDPLEDIITINGVKVEVDYD